MGSTAGIRVVWPYVQHSTAQRGAGVPTHSCNRAHTCARCWLRAWPAGCVYDRGGPPAFLPPTPPAQPPPSAC